jgi:hypothetical protein
MTKAAESERNVRSRELKFSTDIERFNNLGDSTYLHCGLMQPGVHSRSAGGYERSFQLLAE